MNHVVEILETFEMPNIGTIKNDKSNNSLKLLFVYQFDCIQDGSRRHRSWRMFTPNNLN